MMEIGTTQVRRKGLGIFVESVQEIEKKKIVKINNFSGRVKFLTLGKILKLSNGQMKKGRESLSV